MELITIYHNARCSKSRDSYNLLHDSKLDFETKEYLKTPLSKEELKDILSKLSMPAKDLVRTGEKVYKERFKGKELSEEEWIEAMLEFPRLMQRPIVMKGEKAVIGRPIERVAELVKA